MHDRRFSASADGFVFLSGGDAVAAGNSAPHHDLHVHLGRLPHHSRPQTFGRQMHGISSEHGGAAIWRNRFGGAVAPEKEPGWDGSGRVSWPVSGPRDADITGPVAISRTGGRRIAIETNHARGTLSGNDGGNGPDFAGEQYRSGGGVAVSVWQPPVGSERPLLCWPAARNIGDTAAGTFCECLCGTGPASTPPDVAGGWRTFVAGRAASGGGRITGRAQAHYSEDIG